MMFASILFFIFLNDGMIKAYEGVILIFLLIGSIAFLIKYQKQTEEDVDLEMVSDESISKSILFLILGGFFLYLGSEWFVSGAIDLANIFGVSERIIGITVVSIGTSIPELVTSLVALFKKEKGVSLGNLIGSNIFNLLAVIGIATAISPVKLPENILSVHYLIMLSLTLLIFIVTFRKNKVIKKYEGFTLLVIFCTYIVYVISQS